MIDFDEMDEAAAARLEEDGEDEAALLGLGAVEPPGTWRGGRLPPMRAKDLAGTWLPSRRDLPAFFEAHGVKAGGLFREEESCDIKARLLIFYGAGDSVASWINFVNALPGWLDVALFESPGHGFRKAEEAPDTLVELAREAYSFAQEVLEDHMHGGSLEGAPFAMLGHSMGAQVMVEVAALAKRRLGVEPVCLFPVDRGAPHLALYTEEGYRLLCMDEPQEFFDGFNPQIGKVMRDPARHKAGTDHERQIRMWQGDLRRAQEHSWALGDHIFRCPIHVFCAEENFATDEIAKAGSWKGPLADLKRYHELNCKITTSGAASSSPWSRESYAAWEHWTTETCKCHWIQAGHVTIKTHPDTARLIVDALSRAIG